MHSSGTICSALNVAAWATVSAHHIILYIGHQDSIYDEIAAMMIMMEELVIFSSYFNYFSSYSTIILCYWNINDIFMSRFFNDWRWKSVQRFCDCDSLCDEQWNNWTKLSQLTVKKWQYWFFFIDIEIIVHFIQLKTHWFKMSRHFCQCVTDFQLHF